MRWILPESIEDVLPGEAIRLEALRRAILDGFSCHGYEFVIPPMLEFLDSLLTGSGGDLDLRTFKFMDQLSGRSLGVRADMTPQVARVDAHLLNRKGVARLCYCGSVLHTLPSGIFSTREPIQIGAEIYGHEGIEADIEIIRLLADSLQLAGLSASRMDLGHVGIFRALVSSAGVAEPLAQDLFSALQAKDSPRVAELAETLPEDVARALRMLPQLYGGADVLDFASQELRVPGLAGDAIQCALGELKTLAAALDDLPLSFDLADLRGYHYHNGVAFAAYTYGSSSAIARGGRYDKVSEAYGRVRPATGFSMDLREITRLVRAPALPLAIRAPWSADLSLITELKRLRAMGERVFVALPGHQGTWREAGCDRQLVRKSGVWVIEVLEEA